MIRFLCTFALGCAIGATVYAIGNAGYQPGMIAQLTLLWSCLIASNVTAFAFLCGRIA